MSADFEFGHIPSSVFVRGPLDMSKLRFIRGVIIVDIKWKFD